jgi:repressor LexA
MFVVEMSTREQMLRFIADYIRRKSWAPTVREIGKALNIDSTGHVDYHLKELHRAGLIYREPSARCIRLTGAGRAYLEGEHA